MSKIKIAETDDEILGCYPVMLELRPRFRAAGFLRQVRRQMSETDFRLVYLDETGVKAVGSYRTGKWLAGGKYLEIEDLVSKSDERSRGYGGELFDWIVERAKQQNCDHVRLVSRVDRFGAHRFYLNKRMIIEAHYFSMTL